MANASEVVALHHAEPELCPADIARRLRCTPEYVRATASRQGLKLPRGRGGPNGRPRPAGGQPRPASRLKAYAHQADGKHWVDIIVIDPRGLGVKRSTITVFFDGEQAERKASAYATAINAVDQKFHGVPDIIHRHFPEQA